MPPACARVVITHLSIRMSTPSVASPRVTLDPTRESSPSPSSSTFALKRRGSHGPNVAVDTSDTRAPGLSWNALAAPSKGFFELFSGDSDYLAILDHVVRRIVFRY